MSGEKPREIALRVLSGTASEFVEDRLDAALSTSRMAPVDRRLCQELVYGTVRWRATLDWLIEKKTPGRSQKPLLQNLLRLGLYQIFWLERIPPHAAVNETVELARQDGGRQQAGFVNALLRGYLREFEPTQRLLEELKHSQPHLGFSHPEWLVARWTKRWDPIQTRQLLEWNNTPPKTFARVNRLKADAAKLLTQWRDEDVEYDFVRAGWIEENLMFELKAHPPIVQLPSFEQGLFYIQDPSTLAAVDELGPQPGETVLDLCAAPGGKLTYMAQLMGNAGRLIAHDLNTDRLRLIETNCKRLGVTCVESILPSQLASREPSPYDRILVDAPCSNTGVMRRRVDLRWRLRPNEITRLAKTQTELLRQSVPLLKPGGTMVYSTCSLEPEENEAIVDWALREFPQLKLQTSKVTTPFTDKVDGAFVAKMVSSR